MWPKACNRDKKGSRQKLVSFPVQQQRVGNLSLNLLPTLHNLIWHTIVRLHDSPTFNIFSKLSLVAIFLEKTWPQE